MMHTNGQLYRITNLLNEKVNPRAVRKRIMTALGYKSRSTFYNKTKATTDSTNRFTVGEEELIAEQLGVPVSEIFFQTNLQPV